MGDLDEQLKLVTDRKDSSTASTAAASKAIKLELEFLRTQNALIEAGVAASEAETIVREKKTQLQLQSKGLTAAEADEYITLENAIDDATEAEKRRQAALMASTKIGVEDDPMLLKLDAQKRGQALILEEQEIWQAKMAENEQMIQDQTLSTLGKSIGAMKGFFESGTAEYAAFVMAQKGVMAMQAIMAANLAATMALTTIIPRRPNIPVKGCGTSGNDQDPWLYKRRANIGIRRGRSSRSPRNGRFSNRRQLVHGRRERAGGCHYGRVRCCYAV